MIKDSNSKLTFDDFTENEPSCEKSHWSQLCEDHAVHSDQTLQEMPNEGPLCGVEGCSKEALYYYDFYKEN